MDANVHRIAAIGHLGPAKTNKVPAVAVEDDEASVGLHGGGDLRFGGDCDAVDVLCLAVSAEVGDGIAADHGVHDAVVG